MTLAAPLGLLALLAMPALVAAYFLRRRQPPRTVSALFLWRTPDQRAEAGPRLNRFSREASLAIELLAVLFAALFLADLRCGENAPKQHVVIVLDGSLSMNALTSATSAADRARTLVASIARAENAGVLTLIESGVKPVVLAGPQQERDRALSTLEKWTPAQPAHDPSTAFTLARELSGGGEHRIFFLTDGPLPEAIPLPPNFEARSVGTSADNVAFLSAQRRDENGFAQVTVRVGNFSDKATEVKVQFTAPDDKPQSHFVKLAASGTAVLRVGFKSKEPIEAQLPDDALPQDGHLTLLPAPLADVSVSLLDGLDANAQQALRRFLSVAVGVKVTSPSLLTIGPPGTQGNTLLDDVQLGGVVWTAGENPQGRALMTAGDVVLVSEADDGALHFNLDVGRSNVQRTVAWPVLLSNVVRQVRLGAPGFPRKHLMLGEDTPLVASAGSTWELRGPNGEKRPVMGSGILTLPPLSASGRWSLSKDGDEFDSLVVLPLDPRESDLRDRGAYEIVPPQAQAFASLASTHPRPWWPLLVVLLLVLADFWLTAAPRKKEAAA
jgi:hypothetical protein